jgi:hypothetical protein
MSLYGTNLPIRNVRYMAAFGGDPDICSTSWLDLLLPSLEHIGESAARRAPLSIARTASASVSPVEILSKDTRQKRGHAKGIIPVDVCRFPRVAQAALANSPCTDLSKASSFCTLGRFSMCSKCATQCLRLDRSSSNCRARR